MRLACIHRHQTMLVETTIQPIKWGPMVILKLWAGEKNQDLGQQSSDTPNRSMSSPRIISMAVVGQALLHFVILLLSSRIVIDSWLKYDKVTVTAGKSSHSIQIRGGGKNFSLSLRVCGGKS